TWDEQVLADTCHDCAAHDAAELSPAARCKTHDAQYPGLRDALGQARLARVVFNAHNLRWSCDQRRHVFRRSSPAYPPVRCSAAELHGPPDDGSAYPSGAAHFAWDGRLLPGCDGHALPEKVADQPQPTDS